MIENLIYLIIIVVFIIFGLPIIQRRMLIAKRISIINKLERKHASRIITMIHRQEALSLFGFPIIKYIDIEDSERILRAIHLTDEDVPIEIIMHTPGGLALASEQIASALQRHRARVTAYVPHYAMSGGTMIALTADEIIMDHDAVMGPIDPQIGDPTRGSYPAASILAALKKDNPNRSDNTLILGDIAEKAIRQTGEKTFNLLKNKMDEKKARKIAHELTIGQWTHDYPITSEKALELGLNVATDMPLEVYELMELYPQAAQRRPSVEYIPTPYRYRRRRTD